MSAVRNTRFIRPGKLFDAIVGFDPKHATTRGEFVYDCPYLLRDMEWNHMDQLHRPFIHKTYSDNVRIALGRDYATSLTRWGKWPLLIAVSDMRIEEGLFYQSMTIGGLFFVQLVISMEDIEPKANNDNTLRLRIEWIIHSHRWLKPLHSFLSRKFYTLNARLQEEDYTIRSVRHELRGKGYQFASDPPDYYNANRLTNNTLYPPLPDNANISLEGIPLNRAECRSAGNMDFLVLCREEEILLWPAACPHEGGNLITGKLHDGCRMECPWHGLKFNAAKLSVTEPRAEAYGFAYELEGNTVKIRQSGKQAAAA